MGDTIDCYHLLRNLYKNNTWFWSGEIYKAEEIINRDFSIEELLNENKIKIARSSNPEELSLPTYYEYTKEQYEEDMEAVERILKDKRSGKNIWYRESFADGYIQMKIKCRIGEKESGK